ncbi:DUF1656 domain-containing protein [Chelatococcus reniformis]|uniref:Membrane protein n=1 Tax=Chelatococcus reniformis TaxID=1494448 RepID=A0A916UAK5_9HYPH|nr:DUF1656 domain-containing protein [Chelatococcus reniformis]GGC65280.1 membrane protein [Chelatococcus reniformis]
MPLELDLYGVYLPGVFGLMLAAYLIVRGLRAVAARTGFYALVWHRALFDLAVYVIVLDALFSYTSKLIP